MTIAITGHRPNKLGNDYDMTGSILARIRTEIELIIADRKPSTLVTGMALGIDQLFAMIALYMEIPFIAAIPCWGQESKWPDRSQKQYQKLVNHRLCTKYYVSDQAYTSNCMQDRNKWMVDHCDLLIAVWDGSEGGTANCVRYAQSINREIIRINPKELEHI